MMPSFTSIVENEKYTVGCTGQAVWIWDKSDTVLAKFKDMRYAYMAAISPSGDIFVVKSVEGQLAVYSFEPVSLVKKFRFSKVDCAQDGGFCFSLDGKFFSNLEQHVPHSAISVYDTADFSLVANLTVDDSMMLTHIQQIDGAYYVLGRLRDDDASGFVAKYRDNEICDVFKITEAETVFYEKHLHQTMFGSQLNDGEEIKFIHTLGELWEFYRKKGE